MILPAVVEFSGSLDGVAGPSQSLVASPEFDVEVPLLPTDDMLDGAGTVGLSLFILACCDWSAWITEATLWFDAVPEPPSPLNLADYANFQNCFSGDGGVLPGCAIFDFKPDGHIDLSDYEQFLLTFAGP